MSSVYATGFGPRQRIGDKINNVKNNIDTVILKFKTWGSECAAVFPGMNRIFDLKTTSENLQGAMAPVLRFPKKLLSVLSGMSMLEMENSGHESPEEIALDCLATAKQSVERAKDCLGDCNDSDSEIDYHLQTAAKNILIFSVRSSISPSDEVETQSMVPSAAIAWAHATLEMLTLKTLLAELRKQARGDEVKS